MQILLRPFFFLAATLLCGASCKKSDDTTPGGGSTGTVPAVFGRFNASVTIAAEGNFIVLKSNGISDHKSPYYQGTAWASTLYEAYNGTLPFSQNPNKIAAFNYVFKIPANPALNTTHEATPLGPIGISINGVPLFNQYAGPSQPLTSEIISFDQYGGHPSPNSMYHYHVEPLYITATKGKSALIGFLLDGFPVYGPLENGTTLTTANLDIYHGHTGVTADYPNGIYHYHITADAPYINGSGFYGTKGSVTQ